MEVAMVYIFTHRRPLESRMNKNQLHKSKPRYDDTVDKRELDSPINQTSVEIETVSLLCVAGEDAKVGFHWMGNPPSSPPPKVAWSLFEGCPFQSAKWKMKPLITWQEETIKLMSTLKFLLGSDEKLPNPSAGHQRQKIHKLWWQHIMTNSCCSA